jgi:hypothetical protein
MRTWTFVLIGLGIRGVDPDIKIGAPACWIRSRPI